MNIVIFGYATEGIKLYMELTAGSCGYNVIGFADNDVLKQGNIVAGAPIMSMDDLVRLKRTEKFSVIIASREWFVIGEKLEKYGIAIEGIYQSGVISKYDRMSFERLDLTKQITLYAGDICDEVHMAVPYLYGLSISHADARHILHDITKKYPLPDNSICAYQAEDVLEHIELEKIVDTINEIYRILKKGGVFRACLPDYFSPYLANITMRDKKGTLLFDPTGGGYFGVNGVEKGGHVWFPTYTLIMDILKKTKFEKVELLCYHTEKGELIRHDIDFDKGHVIRIPREKESGRPVYSIVADAYK